MKSGSERVMTWARSLSNIVGQNQNSHSDLSNSKFCSIYTTPCNVLEYTKIRETFKLVKSGQWCQIFRQRCRGRGTKKMAFGEMPIWRSPVHSTWLSRQVAASSLHLVWFSWVEEDHSLVKGLGSLFKHLIKLPLTFCRGILRLAYLKWHCHQESLRAVSVVC